MTGKTALPDPTDLDGLRRLLAASEDVPDRRPIGLRTVRIGPDALDVLPDAVAAIRGPGPVVVLVDETLIRRAGSDLKAMVATMLLEPVRHPDRRDPRTFR